MSDRPGRRTTFTGRPGLPANILAFVAITALAGLATVGLLILLDPRSQAFWIDRWEELKAILDATFGPLLRRP